MKYRHYGKTLERMIDSAVEMEEGEKKDQLIRLLVNQMKSPIHNGIENQPTRIFWMICMSFRR